MRNCITTYELDEVSGLFAPVPAQEVSTLSALPSARGSSSFGINAASEIYMSPGGELLYVSNRGLAIGKGIGKGLVGSVENSVTVYAVHPTSGQLAFVESVDVGAHADSPANPRSSDKSRESSIRPSSPASPALQASAASVPRHFLPVPLHWLLCRSESSWRELNAKRQAKKKRSAQAKKDRRNIIWGIEQNIKRCCYDDIEFQYDGDDRIEPDGQLEGIFEKTIEADDEISLESYLSALNEDVLLVGLQADRSIGVCTPYKKLLHEESKQDNVYVNPADPNDESKRSSSDAGVGGGEAGRRSLDPVRVSRKRLRCVTHVGRKVTCISTWHDMAPCQKK